MSRLPAKVLPDEVGFAWLERELYIIGFRHINKTEFKKDFQRFGLVAPSPREGRETGFVYSINGLTVKVWTTWLSAEGRAREVDTGWVLILDGDKPVYFSHPIHRTKNFLLTLYKKAWIAKWRILHRPLCPECRQFMDIVSGPALKSRYWLCDERELHQKKKRIRLNWDSELPPKARRFVELERKARAKAKKKRMEEGRAIIPAIKRRIGWRKTRPPHGIG